MKKFLYFLEHTIYNNSFIIWGLVSIIVLLIIIIREML